MTQLQAIRWFADQVAGEHVVIARERSEWAMSLAHPYPYLMLPQDLTECGEWDHAFRKDFLNRYPKAVIFSDVTLSLLHEIGHHFTREAFINTTEEEYEQATGWDHFKIHCEVVATNWAIKWLKNREHQRLAKAFEREFFG